MAWKIGKSSSCNKLFVAPGNAGTQDIATNINIDINNFKKIKECVLKENIKLVVVGPEDPLVNGIYDFFKYDKELEDVLLIGPSKKGAQLEGSKEFAKEFMSRHNIPTAKYWATKSKDEALKILERFQRPLVIKADGLAAGKGVTVCETIEQSKDAIKAVSYAHLTLPTIYSV